MGENKLYCMRCFEAMEDSSNTCPHCGWHNGDQVKNALPYGTLLGEKYLVGQAVHVNGAGITYAALEAKTAQKVEVREFYPHTIAVRGETGASVLPVSGAELKFSDYLSEFERYAQKLLRVSDTKHIQRAIDTFSQNNTQYIVFSFTESVSLRQYVEEHGVLSWAQCEQFFYPVIHTLGAIHAQNVEHLGISPNTLRITKDDKMIVTGFDIQSVRRAGTDLIEDIFPGCWALEQYSKTKICDEVTDVYGLCASLLFALTGAAPMEAPKRKQDPRLMISKNILKQLPEQVIPAIANGLQVDPSHRTSSFSRFSAELAAEPTVVEKFVETETVRSLPSGSGRTPSKRRVPTFLWLVASFVFTLVVIFAVTSVWFKDSPFSPQSIVAFIKDPGVVEDKQTLEVPNLVGMDYDKLLSLTEKDKKYKFELEIYKETFSDTLPEGQITGQYPLAGEIIEAGSTVKIAVCKGPQLRTLPDISDMMADEAMTKLKALGFEPVQVAQYSEDTKIGRVIGYQSDSPGDALAYGAVVGILVSAESSGEDGE